MRFFFCLILLSCIFVEYSLTINDNDLIRCTSHCPESIVSFSESTTFPEECQDNDNTSSIYDYGSVCNVEYRIHFDTQQIYIKLKATNDTSSLGSQKPSEHLGQKIRLRFTGDVNEPNEVTRSYDCNTKNDCAKDFYLSTIEYLVNDGKLKLDLIKTKLYNDTLVMGPRSRRHCFDSDITITDSKKTIRCGDGFCYAKVEYNEFNENQHKTVQKCILDRRAGLSSDIEHHAPKSAQKDKELIEYKCNKHVCNRNDMIPKIKELIDEYTQWNPIVAPESKSMNDIKDSSSIKRTISSYILILFLILTQLFI